MCLERDYLNLDTGNFDAHLDKFSPLVGRVFISTIFLLSGIGKIGGFANTAGYMASKGIPMVNVLLAITIVIEIGTAVMLIIGWKARWAAALLFLWMIPVTVLFRNFWAVPADQQTMRQIMFLKNLAIMGGLLYIMAFGSGRYSVDRR